MTYSAPMRSVATVLAILMVTTGILPLQAFAKGPAATKDAQNKQRLRTKTRPDPTPTPAPAAAAPATAPTTAPATPSASPGAPPQAEKPFADVTKDFEVTKGLFNIYRKDEKTYLEIMPDQL